MILNYFFKLKLTRIIKGRKYFFRDRNLGSNFRLADLRIPYNGQKKR